MATYYHWVGATANSVDKYDWNIASNWIVQSTGINTTTANTTPYSRATRSPIAGDSVIIGETFHCLSPLLFGGFSGSTGHSAGDWGNGYTAGATAGGINLTVQTDMLAASSIGSWSQIGDRLRNPDGTFYYGLAMGGVWGASGSFSQNMTDENFFYLLRAANPHFPMGTWNRLTGAPTRDGVDANEMAFYGSYDAFCQTVGCNHVDGEYGSRATKYPFPFLGGGLTGMALQWALGQYRKSYYGYGLGKGGTANDAWVASRSDAVNAAALRNAWIGGGISGSAAALAGTANRAANTPLRLRIQSLTFQNPAYQVGGESINNPLYADIDLVGDKAADGTIASTIYINQPKCTNHAFRLEGGTIRSLSIVGDSSVDVVGMTAATVNSEYTSYIRSDSTSRFGGLRIKQNASTDRYNTYSGWHMAGITSGARYAVWGAQATAANKDANAGKLILEQANAYDINANQIPGVSSTAYLNPMFAIGVVDGTTGQTGGAATIPTMESKSGMDLGSVWQIHFAGPALIQRIDDSGSNYVVASPLATKTNSVQVGTLNGSNGTIVDFRANPDVDNIYFGGTTGSGNAMRIIGGIVSLDDTVSIIPSKGCSFVNTKTDGIIDGRSSHKSGNTQFSIFGEYGSIDAPAPASAQ